MRAGFLLGAISLLPAAAAAQDIEDFRVEITASIWIRGVSGTIQSGILPVDLASDLGIDQDQPQFSGRLVLKPARRHRLLVEGTPYRLNGDQVIARQITFAGRTYSFQDRVTTAASIDYIFGGYQFDFLSRPAGHWGVQAGVAYANATGTLTDAQRGFTGTETQSFPFPLAGTEFRAQPLARYRLLSLRGEVKGMSLGSWGHYVQGEGGIGVSFGRHVTAEAEYRVVDADIHRQDQTRGFTPRFTGPLFSIQFRD